MKHTITVETESEAGSGAIFKWFKQRCDESLDRYRLIIDPGNLEHEKKKDSEDKYNIFDSKTSRKMKENVGK